MKHFCPIPTGLRPSAQQRCLLGKVFLDFFGGFGFFGEWRLGESFELVIHMDNQSAHDGSEGNFARFVPFSEAGVKGLEHGIATNGTER